MSFKQLMENRRSVNFFNPNKPLADELLNEIIDTAVLAPSAFNLQPWRIIAVKSKEAKEKLLPLAFNQPKITDAPVTLILVGNRKAYEASNPAWEVLKAAVGEEGATQAQGTAAFLYGTSEERGIKFAESNTGILAMAIMAAAKEKGVEAHPMSGLDFDGIKAAFNLKPEEDVVMTLAMGYFDESKELYPRQKRFGSDVIVETV